MAKYGHRYKHWDTRPLAVGRKEMENRTPGHAHRHSAEAAAVVRKLALLGVPQHLIAHKIGVDPKTMRKYYRDDLETGDLEAFASVAGALWHNAVKNNNVIAQIFWMKARHGWVDRREVNHNHTVGPQLSHEERLKLLEADPPDPRDPAQRPAIIEGAYSMVNEGLVEPDPEVAAQAKAETGDEEE